jgi:hypothetical protein
MLLGVTFASNIGGMLTPISSPQNAISAEALPSDRSIDFLTWMLVSRGRGAVWPRARVPRERAGGRAVRRRAAADHVVLPRGRAQAARHRAHPRDRLPHGWWRTPARRCLSHACAVGQGRPARAHRGAGRDHRHHRALVHTVADQGHFRRHGLGGASARCHFLRVRRPLLVRLRRPLFGGRCRLCSWRSGVHPALDAWLTASSCASELAFSRWKT